MLQTAIPAKNDLYRLPFSLNDSPIGWVEVTDICNIKCKGCYRLALGQGHKPVDQIKEEILFLRKWRNCDSISLAGGEPILHPDILEIVSFIRANKMKCLILTNGYALTEALLKDMKKAGLMGWSLHLDITQTRPDFQKRRLTSELQLNEMRLNYAKKVKKYGFYAHFGITVTADNLKEAPDFIQWAVDNSKLVNGLSLILYRVMPVMPGIEYYAGDKKIAMKPGDLGYAADGKEYDRAFVKSQDAYAVIKKRFSDYEAMAYLGGTADHTSYKWLVGSILVNSKGKSFGSIGPKSAQLAQAVYHYKKGSYFVYPKKRVGKSAFIMALFDPWVRKALVKYLGYCLKFPIRFFYPVKALGIGMIQAPDLNEEGQIDMCDGCPDMCVFEGKLVNSCRLDECRLHGELLHVHLNKKSRKIEKNIEAIENAGSVTAS